MDSYICNYFFCEQYYQIGYKRGYNNGIEQAIYEIQNRDFASTDIHTTLNEFMDLLCEEEYESFKDGYEKGFRRSYQSCLLSYHWKKQMHEEFEKVINLKIFKKYMEYKFQYIFEPQLYLLLSTFLIKKK